MSPPPFDLIVFGATSFVGRILCRYLCEQFGPGQSLRWAAAGRSASRLEALRCELGATDLELIVADADSPGALRALCAQGRVIASTVGPYALYGEALVEACARSGTDYCDLTGEVHWVRRMIDRYEHAASQSGARIVPCCGFDSIPSDMGVYYLQNEARQRFGQACTHISMRVVSVSGGFSGGTAASLLNVLREARADPALRHELADPYSLCPAGHPFKTRQDDITLPRFEQDFESWAAPFMMASINTRVVHRSNALSQPAYGPDFRYDEAMLTGAGWRGRIAAGGVAAGLATLMLAGATRPSRWLLEQVLPSPGEGPSERQQQQGYFDLSFIGRTADGRLLRAAVSGDRDPGYGATAKMIGQAAASLALDIDKKEKAGGFWTPATIFDQRFVQRLRDHAGMGFTIVD